MSKDNDNTADDKANTKNTKLTAEHRKYLKFGAMIATSMIIMYAVMYLNTYQISHISWSETRFFMTLLMGSTMTLVMLAFMTGMYKNFKINLGIIFASLLLFVLGTFLVRSQKTVDDTSWMSGMIPHHSIAILTSENANIQDVRVCKLAKNIIEAQKKEIAEMKWLIQDIQANGPVYEDIESKSRSAPDFTTDAIRTCE